MNNYGENLIVIIVTWNRVEYTLKTLKSLLLTVPKAKFIFIDNNSTDGTKEMFKDSTDTKHTIILRDKNEGWGVAVNEALAYINYHNLKSDYILLSNNDVEYYEGWYEKAMALYNKYSNIGVLGLWKHTSHGVKQDLGDLIVKDQMPATCWLMKPDVLRDIGEVSEHGECLTKGGNGEDVDYCIRAENKGYLIAGPAIDLASHIDGY